MDAPRAMTLETDQEHHMIFDVLQVTSRNRLGLAFSVLWLKVLPIISLHLYGSHVTQRADSEGVLFAFTQGICCVCVAPAPDPFATVSDNERFKTAIDA